jgi:membrane protein implicated in regulation of membrane protease activity
MSGWVLWLIAACAFGIATLLTRRLWFASFVIGAALAAGVDRAGAGGLPAWIVFALGWLAAFVLLLQVARARQRTLHAEKPEGAAALIGKQAIVIERIANREGLGFVRIDGEVWTARALDGEREIQRGARVEVVQVKGATAVVAQ